VAKSRVLIALCAVFLSTGALGAPVSAETSSDASPPVDTGQIQVLDTAAALPAASGDTALAGTVSGTTIVVPSDPATGITVDPSNGPKIEIGLPSAAKADNAEPVAPGAVSYDSNNGSATVPVAQQDGSISVNTVINTADAPERYRFPVTVDGGGSVVLNEDGGATVLDADGATVSTVAAPWAKDATGAAIPTHFEATGTTLTQVVEHRNANAAYPVTADPWFGFRLISRVVWKGNTLEVYPTTYGRYPWLSGTASRWAAWSEVVSLAPRANRSNMRDQFLCHYDLVRFRAPNKPSWNLDINRRDVGYWSTVAANCNP
jgi:hypothetical protein